MVSGDRNEPWHRGLSRAHIGSCVYPNLSGFLCCSALGVGRTGKDGDGVSVHSLPLCYGVLESRESVRGEGFVLFPTVL